MMLLSSLFYFQMSMFFIVLFVLFTDIHLSFVFLCYISQVIKPNPNKVIKQ